jgi:hypothetical protein
MRITSTTVTNTPSRKVRTRIVFYFHGRFIRVSTGIGNKDSKVSADVDRRRGEVDSLKGDASRVLNSKIVCSLHGAALEGNNKGKDDAGDTDDRKSHVGGDTQELLSTSQYVEVEDEDRDLGGHQRQVIESKGCVLARQQRGIPGGGYVAILAPQALGGAEVDGEGHAKGEDLVFNVLVLLVTVSVNINLKLFRLGTQHPNYISIPLITSLVSITYGHSLGLYVTNVYRCLRHYK